MEENVRNNEISIKEIILVLLHSKFLIVAITGIITLLTIVITVFFMSKNNTVARIELNFSSLSANKNPDGTGFNSEQIISPSVIQKSLVNLGLDKKGFDLNDIRNAIIIKSVIPNDIAELYKLKEQGKYSDPINFVPTNYVLTLTSKWFRDITKDEAEIILDNIVYGYKEDFIQRYGEEKYVGMVDFTFNQDEYDYDESLEILRSHLENLKVNVDNRLTLAGNFRGSNGLSFNEIANSVNVFMDVDLIKTEALVNMFYLTKNQDRMVKRFEYKVKNYELEANKKKKEESDTSKILESVESPKSFILDQSLLSGDANINSLIESTIKNDYYTYLVKKAAEAGTEAVNKDRDKEYYQNEINLVKNNVITNEQKTWAVNETKESIDLISSFINQTYKQYNELNEEYINRENSSMIRVLLDPVTERNLKNFLIYAAVGFFAGLFIACFIVLFKNYWNSEDEKKVEKEMEIEGGKA